VFVPADGYLLNAVEFGSDRWPVCWRCCGSRRGSTAWYLSTAPRPRARTRSSR